MQRKKLDAAQAEQQALLKVAQAQGDELAAAKARDALRGVSAKLELLAQAKTAEAEALRKTTAALRDEMAAAGPLTQQQQQRLRIAENAARALEVEAQAARQSGKVCRPWVRPNSRRLNLPALRPQHRACCCSGAGR